MPYKSQLQKTFRNFPGIVEGVDELNSILINLKEKGFHKLVENCLKNKSSYSSVPFLFEVFIANWLLQGGSIQNIKYEPEDYSDRIDRHDETRRRKKALPDFTFSIEDKNFVISLKTITQVSNEETRRKITAEIKKRFKDGIPNIQIWLSPEIEDGDINEIVNWVVKEEKNLSANEEARFLGNTGEDTEPLATIKKLSSSQGIMVKIIGSGPINDPLPPVDSQGIRDKIKNVTKKAYKCFPNDNDGAYNFFFLFTDVLFVEHELEEALLGTEGFVQYQGCNQLRCRRENDGIFSKGKFSKLDAVFFFPPKTDFLKKNFNPQVVINPQKIEKLQNIPEPFKSLFCPSQDLNEFGAKL